MADEREGAVEARKEEIAEVGEMVERVKRYDNSLRKYKEAFIIDYDYIFKLKQHSSSERRELERKDRLKVVSLDLYDIGRYGSNTISGSQIYVDVEPAAPTPDLAPGEDDPAEDIAQVCRQMMENQTSDIDVGYPRVRRRFTKLGYCARAGAARLDVVPDPRGGANVVPAAIPPENLSWDAQNFIHFNDPGCPELWEELRVDFEWAKGNEEFDEDFRASIHPDDGRALIRLPKEGPKLDVQAAERGRMQITLKVGWLKEDPGEVEVETDEDEELPESDRYMACPTCGYSEADLRQRPDYHGEQLPESAACPQCGMDEAGEPIGHMHRIDVGRKIGKMPAYENGHRRVILAPFCPNAGFAKDGPWPPKLTNFPYLLYVPDPYPSEPYGNSVTCLNMDLQSLKNASLRSGFEQMDRNRDLLIAKFGSLWDSRQEPYQFDGSGDYVAYTQDYDSLNGIKHFQGNGLNPSYGVWMGVLDENLSKFRGIGQVSASAEQMKGMPVGTVARIQETGDVPLDEALKILREDEEQLFTRWLEMGMGHWTEAQWVSVTGPDGTQAFRLFHGTRVPPMRLRVMAAPDLSVVDGQTLDRIKGLIGAPPAVLRFAGQAARIPKKLIDQMIQETSPQPASPGNGGPMGPAGPAIPNGMQGAMGQPAGMVPAGA